MNRGSPGPLVVLIGATGSGKSTLVEKVTGLRDLSSSTFTSFTQCAKMYTSSCARLRVADTPGGDAMGETATERVRSNMWIAQALSTHPVSLILVVVRAETRVDAVVGRVRPYVDTFLDFADNLAVCVTHMDTVTWTPEDCSRHLVAQLDLSLAVYADLTSPGDTVTEQLLQCCRQVEPVDITIDSDNFLNFFRIHDNSRKVLKNVKAEVDRFQAAVQQFHQELEKLGEADRADAVFEFQAFMNAEIIAAQNRVYELSQFEERLHQPDEAANAIGHMANLRLQLRNLLVNVRKLSFRYQSEAGVSELRQCPHCGQVWHLVVGCPDTTCGNPVNYPDARRLQMATFCFEIRTTGLFVEKRGYRVVQRRQGSRGVGCGRSIKWNEMKPVPPPPELLGVGGVTFTVKDIALLSEHEQRSWAEFYAEVFQSLRSTAPALGWA